MVITGLIAVLGAVGTFQSFKEKNVLGIIFNFAALAIFGWFTVMTIIYQGYPPKLH
jgi:hypothetical protein